MTVETQNEAQLFHLNVTIFLHNPTAPSCACLILARFFTIVVAEIRLLNYSCCRIGDLASAVSLAQK